jgi:3-deoxy-7-phosphoheptulonate synthase
MPLSAGAELAVAAGRKAVADSLVGADPRPLVIVGPCSVHDRAETLDYGRRLTEAAAAYADELLIVMRCYVEKSRSGEGWRGMARDPALDGTGRAAEGVRVARALLVELAGRSPLPLAMELAGPFLWPYFIDALSWASVGARGVESPALREVAAALPCPCGFKNGRDGRIEAAVAAATVASKPGTSLAVGDDGRLTEMTALGNPLPHIILRGADGKPNWRRAPEALRRLVAAGLKPALIVDASHGNSGKEPTRQASVALGAMRLRRRIPGIRGVMIESYLRTGCQAAGQRDGLKPGLSITDPCLGWDETKELLAALAKAEQKARQKK